MTTTTDDLRRALAVRAAAIDVPDAPPVGALRQRALLDRLRTVTTVAAALLLVTGLVTVLRDSSSSPSTVDSRLGRPSGGDDGSPSTTEATTATSGVAPNAPPPPSSGAGPRQLPTTTTATIPPKVGPIGVGNSPPTTRGPDEPPFAVAQPGSWYYRIAGEQEPGRKDVLGNEDASFKWPDAYLDVRPAEGRRQRTRSGSFPYVTVVGAVRTLGPDVTLEELTLWDGTEDSKRVFRLPPRSYEVPARSDWDKAWSYQATSTDGTTHLKVSSRVTDPRDVVALEDGSYTSYEGIRIESVIDVSGDRTSHIERTVWWSADLGVAVKIVEVETGKRSDGSTFRRKVSATLRYTEPSPESLNRQAVPDEDHDGMPDAADEEDSP